jgi:predicted DCC family thiol-disulfide oxidoreductase YuxK
MTDNIATPPTVGWVCYDSECALCLRWVRRIERPLRRHGFDFVPLQTAWAKARLKLTANDPLTEMRLLRPDQHVLGGADAVVALMRHVWWLWPLWLFSRIPGAMRIFHAAYRHIAANRHCANDACSLGSSRRKEAQINLRRWLDWLPLVVLLVVTLPFRAHLPNWIFMWLFVTAMFAGCKWLTWRRAKVQTLRPARTLGFLFLWPGMDAKSFLTGLCLISFGLGTFFLADELASGTPLARALCGFLAVFWIVRFVAGSFDLRPYLTSTRRRVGLFAANLIFTALPFVYGWAALKGVRP